MTLQNSDDYRHGHRGRAAVSLHPGEGQSEESIADDIERSLSFMDSFAENGTERWKSHYRWWGPFKVMVAKEVGPPPWRWPQVHATLKRGPLFFGFIVGWRLTGYRFNVLWQRHSEGGGQ